jgi:hypothetical protein
MFHGNAIADGRKDKGTYTFCNVLCYVFCNYQIGRYWEVPTMLFERSDRN